MKTTKNCARCGELKCIDEFVTIYGYHNPRGKYCLSCFTERQQEQAIELLEGRDFCLYCGDKILKAYDWLPNGESERTYLNRDHMDPLALGGEDSDENTVFCCVKCNLKKGKKAYVEWLKCLGPENRQLARRIYIEKQGQKPEQFVPRDTSIIVKIEFS